MKFSPKAPKLVRNEVVVQLMDSFSNPVVSEQSKLNLELATTGNMTGFSSWMFVDNNDGSYTGHYLSMEVGTYEMCILFDGKNLSPCPFVINVYGSKSVLLQLNHEHLVEMALNIKIFFCDVFQVNIFLKHMMIQSLFGKMSRLPSICWKMTTLLVAMQVLLNSPE